MTRRWTLCILLTFGSVTAVHPSAAQTEGGFALDRYEPAERGSDWFAGESLDLRGEGRPAMGVVFDYAHRPLLAYDDDGTARWAVVSHQFVAHLGASYIVRERLRLGLSLPWVVSSAGDRVTTPEGSYSMSGGTALGDVRLGIDYGLLGTYGSALSLAAGVQVFLPTGSRSAFASDGTLRARPRLMAAGDLGPFAYALQAGVALRPHEIDYAGAALGSEFYTTAAAGFRLWERRVIAGAELSTSTVLRGAFERATTPLELLFGAKYSGLPDWKIGLGAGPGLSQGLGSPEVRALASIEWMPEPEPVRERDSDQDGLLDSADACAATPAGPKPDPLRPGCPAPDRDRDGFVDPEDGCPDIPGLASPDPRQRGCPPAPKPDRDGDGTSDDVDACPTETGPPDKDPKLNGCPRARMDTEAKQIRILQRIEFAYDQSSIRRTSTPVVDSVRKILVDHPEITQVEIQGHSDNVGGAEYNLGLSQQRADTVRLWLITHGIAASRLRAVGYGKERPIDTNDTEPGRQNNRRVEFHIELTPPPASAPDAPPTSPSPKEGRP